MSNQTKFKEFYLDDNGWDIQDNSLWKTAIHTIEYAAYEQAQNEIDKYEDKVYHATRKVEELQQENEYLLNVISKQYKNIIKELESKIELLNNVIDKQSFALDRLILKSNVVTAYQRHGLQVQAYDVSKLYEAQINAEEAFKEVKELMKG